MQPGPNESGSQRQRFVLENSLLLVIFAAPAFFGTVSTWASMFLAALLFFLFFWYPDAGFKISRLPFLFRYGILAVFLWLVAQFILSSMNRHATGEELLKWFATACGFLLIQLLPYPSLVRLAYGFVWLGVLEASYGLFQVISGREMVLWQAKVSHLGFVTGTYFNRNHLAGLLEICLGIHLGLWLRSLRDHRFNTSILLALSFLVVTTALLKTGSRMGILSFASALIIFFFIFTTRRPKHAFLFGIVLFLLVAIAIFFGREAFLPRFFNLKENFKMWDQERWLVWQDTFKMIWDHRWSGVGLGSFAWIFPSYQSENLVWGYSHAHNDYLELAAELGLPAFLILIVSFGTLWLKAFSKLVFSPSSFSPLILGCFVSVTSMFLHGFADFNLAVPANALLFSFIWAILIRLLRLSSSQRTVSYE